MTTAGGGEAEGCFLCFVCLLFCTVVPCTHSAAALEVRGKFFCFDTCIIITTFNNKFLIFFFMKEKKIYYSLLGMIIFVVGSHNNGRSLPRLAPQPVFQTASIAR